MWTDVELLGLEYNALMHTFSANNRRTQSPQHFLHLPTPYDWFCAEACEILRRAHGNN
jgi:hypothetical protein